MPQLVQQYFEHITHDLAPGSVRVGHSRASEDIEVTAWRKPDGQLAVILLNRSEQPAPVNLRVDGRTASFLLYPLSITTGLIAP